MRDAAVEALLGMPRAALERILPIARLMVNVNEPTFVRRASVGLVKALPPPLLLPAVVDLLPILREASGDLDTQVREDAIDAIRRLSPLRRQAVRAAEATAKAAALAQAGFGGVPGAGDSGAFAPAGNFGGGAEELREALASFQQKAPMFDPKRPGRRLATHPVELVRCLHDECRRGLITAEERDRLCARVKVNVSAFNAAAKVINNAVRHNEGVIPADETGPIVHGLCAGLCVAASDQASVIEDASGAALDWRGARGAREFVRWDAEDKANREKYGDGHVDSDQETWDNGQSVNGSVGTGENDGDDDFFR